MLPKFATIIACGGAGKRFGEDKALQLLAGETLLARAIRIARSYGCPIALAARNAEIPGSESLPVLLDEQPDLGPISALASGFAFSVRGDCSHVLLLACDQPFLPDDLAKRLADAIGDNGVAIPVSNGHDQNMAALWRCAPNKLKDYIAGGGRSLWRFGESVGITRVNWDDSDADSFTDIDDRVQLAAAEERLRTE